MVMTEMNIHVCLSVISSESTDSGSIFNLGQQLTNPVNYTTLREQESSIDIAKNQVVLHHVTVLYGILLFALGYTYIKNVLIIKTIIPS